MSKLRLLLDSTLAAAAVFGVVLLFGGCTDAQLRKTNDRLVAAQAVAYTACLARQNEPVVATALRNTLEDMVPGASLARGVIAGSCDVILAHPNTTLTFTVPAEAAPTPPPAAPPIAEPLIEEE
jgi:hypothetical protein